MQDMETTVKHEVTEDAEAQGWDVMFQRLLVSQF